MILSRAVKLYECQWNKFEQRTGKFLLKHCCFIIVILIIMITLVTYELFPDGFLM